jgi:hypothetical protein
MAGDWIKMRVDLWDDPRVIRMVSALKADKATICGALYRLWCLADQYTEDGRLDGYDAAALDEAVKVDGFAEALVKVKWLEIEGDNLIVPRFEEHNGASAKRRSMERNRKQRSREVSASDADKMRPRGRGREERDIDGRSRKTSDLDGAMCFSEERRARVCDFFNEICESVACRNEADFDLFGKVSLLRERNEISEDDFEQCLESVRMKKPDIPGQWFHKCLANKMKAQNESFAKMLASCTCPDWLPRSFQTEKSTSQHQRQRAQRARDD